MLDLPLDTAPSVLQREPTVRVLVARREWNQAALRREKITRQRLDPVFSLLGARHNVANLMCAADVVVVPS